MIDTRGELGYNKSLNREEGMKCRIQGCLGEYEMREIVHVVQQGERIMVFEHVPAEVKKVYFFLSLTEHLSMMSSYIRRKKKHHDPIDGPVWTTPRLGCL